jgi:hypothetical protein
MMNENSIDFTSTFRQLAKHVTSGEPWSGCQKNVRIWTRKKL